MNCLSKIREAIQNIEIAKNSEKSYTVTELVRILASNRSRGVGADKGRRVHNFWGDPYEVVRNKEYFCPFPLAYKVNSYWIYGYADLVHFRNCKPVEVIEVKSYKKCSQYDVIQVKLYAYLAYHVFKAYKPKAVLVFGWNGRNFITKEYISWKPEEVYNMILQAINKKQSNK